MTLHWLILCFILLSWSRNLFLLSFKEVSCQSRNNDLLCWLEHSLGGAEEVIYQAKPGANVSCFESHRSQQRCSLLTFNERSNLMSCTTLYHFSTLQKKQKLCRTVTTELCILSLSDSQIKLLHCVYKTIKCELNAKLCHRSVAWNLNNHYWEV